MERRVINIGQNQSRTRIFLIKHNMGDFYILQNMELLNELNMESDILIDITDNYNEVQLGLSQNEEMVVLVSYNDDNKLKVENILDVFENELRTNYKGISIFNFNKNTKESEYSTLLLSLNEIYDNFNDKETFKEMVQRILYSLDLDLTRENDLDDIIGEISSGKLNIDTIAFYNNSDTEGNDNTVISESVPLDNVENNPTSNGMSAKRRDFVLNAILSFVSKRLENDCNIDPTSDEMDSIIENMLGLDKKEATPIIKEEVEDNEEGEVEVIEETVPLTDEEYEKYTGETLEEVSSTESLKDSNKMPSERALELVKFLNRKWLKEIYPNFLHKIENLFFFKENMSKFKVNQNDEPADVIAKVAGGVVQLELLGKNLSKWENDNENWKIDAKHTIKRNQRAWRKEYVKFEKSLLSTIKPLLQNILNTDEDLEIDEDEDSINLCVVDTKAQEVPETNTIDTIKTSSSTESQETNIYDNMSLESLMETTSDELELFEKILNNTNVIDRDNLIKRGLEYNLITNEKLSLVDSIRRKVKVQNKKYNN